MEFADGGSLQEKLWQKLNESQILEILVQLLEGLKYLHCKSIVHGNLRPENILFVRGQLKIADFRFTTARTYQISCNRTQPFLHPEVFVQEPNETPSDIWSAGVIVYYLAAQMLSFYSDSSGSWKQFEELKQLILKSEPLPLAGEFTDEFKSIMNLMLNKNALFRESAENLLIAIRQNFPQLFKTLIFEKSETPRSGILDCFCQTHFKNFIRLCEFETDFWDYEASFHLLSSCFRDHIYLEINKFYQITFKQNQIVLTSYSIRSGIRKDIDGGSYFPLSWQIETLSEANNWTIIDKRENIREMEEKEKLLIFTLTKEILCSTLRITFLKSTDNNYTIISSFELFGKIIDDQNILHNLRSISTEINIVSPMTFIFSETTLNGTFNYFSKFSLKNRNLFFTVESFHTKKNNYTHHLIDWNDENWETQANYGSCFFIINFYSPYIFKILGYRLRSGNRNFPTEWLIIGCNSDHGKGHEEKTVLDEQKSNSTLSSKYVEKSFPKQTEQFFDQFEFELKGNYFEQNEYCLNAVEIFGILREMSEEERILEQQRILEFQRSLNQ
jgi:serine/threonine protein kinase